MFEREEECFSELIINLMIDFVFYGIVMLLILKFIFYFLRGLRLISKLLIFKRIVVIRLLLKRFGYGCICIDFNFYGFFFVIEIIRWFILGVGISIGSSVGLSIGKGFGIGSGVIIILINDVGGDNDDKYDNDEVDDLYILMYILLFGKFLGSFISFKKNLMRFLEKYIIIGFRSKNFVVFGGYFLLGYMYMVIFKVNDCDIG